MWNRKVVMRVNILNAPKMKLCRIGGLIEIKLANVDINNSNSNNLAYYIFQTEPSFMRLNDFLNLNKTMQNSGYDVNLINCVLGTVKLICCCPGHDSWTTAIFVLSGMYEAVSDRKLLLESV